MRIHITCDCGQQLQIDDAMAGRTTNCPKCQRAITVPGEARAGGTAPSQPGGVGYNVQPRSGSRAVLAWLLVLAAIAVAVYLLWFR